MSKQTKSNVRFMLTGDSSGTGTESYQIAVASSVSSLSTSTGPTGVAMVLPLYVSDYVQATANINIIFQLHLRFTNAGSLGAAGIIDFRYYAGNREYRLWAQDSSGSTGDSWQTFSYLNQWIFIVVSCASNGAGSYITRTSLYNAYTDTVPTRSITHTQVAGGVTFTYFDFKMLYSAQQDAFLSFVMGTLFYHYSQSGTDTFFYSNKREASREYLTYLAAFQDFNMEYFGSFFDVRKRSYAGSTFADVLKADSLEFEEITDTGSGGSGTAHSSQAGGSLFNTLGSYVSTVQSKFSSSSAITWRNAVSSGNTNDAVSLMMNAIVSTVNNTIAQNLGILFDSLANAVKTPIFGSLIYLFDGTYYTFKGILETDSLIKNLQNWVGTIVVNRLTSASRSSFTLTGTLFSAGADLYTKFMYGVGNILADRNPVTGAFTNSGMEWLHQQFEMTQTAVNDFTIAWNEAIGLLRSDLGIPTGANLTLFQGTQITLKEIAIGSSLLIVSIVAIPFFVGAKAIIEVLEFIYFTTRYPIPSVGILGQVIPVPTGAIAWIVYTIMDVLGFKIPFTDALSVVQSGNPTYYGGHLTGFGVKDLHHDYFIWGVCVRTVIGFLGKNSYRFLIRLVAGYVLKAILNPEDYLTEIATELGVGDSTTLDEKINRLPKRTYV